MHARRLLSPFTTVLIFLLTASAIAQGPQVPLDRLMQPAELATVLKSFGPKPLILNVGPRMLYAQAHILGAEFIGPTSDAHGIEALRVRVAKLPKTQYIVIYCGCCPWAHCPNIGPAFAELKSLGFKNVKALYISNNLGTDWVYKGYPTEKGQ